jgi:hypothetical protein
MEANYRYCAMTCAADKILQFEPAICLSQDDVINTVIQPATPGFQCNVQVPPGFTEFQVNGGAAGALTVEWMEKVRPEAAGLTPSRVSQTHKSSPNPKSCQGGKRTRFPPSRSRQSKYKVGIFAGLPLSNC